MNQNLKKTLNFLVLIIITCLVLYLALKDDYQAIIHEIATMNIIWLVIAFLLAFCFWFLKALATTNIVRIFKKDYSIKEAFCLVLETNFFHAITPFAVGGQPYEIYSLKKSNLKITDATNVSISNFIVYQIALILLGVIAIIYNHFFNLFQSNELLKHLVTLGFLINLFVIVILFLLTFTKNLNKWLMKAIIGLLNKLKIIKNKEKKINQLNQYLNEFHSGANILFQNKRKFIYLVFIQLLGLSCVYLVPWALSYATSTSNIHMIEAIITSAYVMLIGSFVPIPGGTGGLEYGFIAFYGNLIKGQKLNAIMLVWRFITYYFAMILGAILLGVRKKEKKCV